MTGGRNGAAGPLEAVTFDYWNTLCFERDLDQRRELVADACLAVLSDAGVSIDRGVLTDAYDAARIEYWNAWHANRQFTGDDAARVLCSRIEGTEGHAGEMAGLAERLVEAFHACSETAEVMAVEGVGEALAALRASGVKIGIVCDVGLMASTYLRSHLARHDLLGFFDHWSFSDEVGVYKPDPRIFEHALAGLGGVVPARAVHVGDRRRTDIAGAQEMGMRAVRLTAVFDDDDPDQGPSGDAVVASYEEFLPALGFA